MHHAGMEDRAGNGLEHRAGMEHHDRAEAEM
jgi:hypothetical protein